MSKSPFRDLPPVHELLRHPLLAGLEALSSHKSIVDAARQILDEIREHLSAGAARTEELTPEAIASAVVDRVHTQDQPLFRRVLNATGILLHTNLGRAPLAKEAARAAQSAGEGCLNLEMDLESGQRSSRQNPIRHWLQRLTGAESATAVNNNAAATVIVLRALCAGKEAIVSRGQLIEIGGSFRIPEIMTVSGATLREVGTTNITRLSDYANAIGPTTGAILRIHPSNYRVVGFTESVPLPDLVALGRERGLPVIDDVGSGALVDPEQFGLPGEPLVRESVRVGADVVLFSGDKLLGGPQAGILVGRKEWIDRIERDPLMRAFRLDKMTLAALEATLRLHANPPRALAEIPVLRMLSEPLLKLRQRAEKLAESLRGLPGLRSVRVVESDAYVGGGSIPDRALKSWAVEFEPRTGGEEEFSRRLRTGEPAVVARVRDGKILLDVRTLLPGDEAGLLAAVRATAESKL